MINCCWYAFKWIAAVAAAVVLLGGVYLYTRLDSEIRRHAESVLADHYPALAVHVGAARRVEGQGIVLRDVVLAEPRPGGGVETILAIDEILLTAEAGLAELVKGKVQVDQIVVRRPTCRAICRADGRWNLDALLPPSGFGDGPLNLLVEGGQIELFASADVDEPLVFRDIRLVAQRRASNRASASRQLGSSGPPLRSHRRSDRHLKSSATQDGAPIRLEMEFASQLVERARIQGTIDAHTRQISLRGDVTRLHVTPQLFSRLPPFSQPIDCAGVEGVVEFAFRIAGSLGAAEPLAFSITDGKLSAGRVDHPRLPRPLTGLEGDWSCDTTGLVVSRLAGRFGQAEFSLACQRTGWTAAAPVRLHGTVRNLAVDEPFFAGLAAPLQGLWQKFRPEGIVDLTTAELAFDGQRWRPQTVVINCHDMSLRAEKFPYPVTRGRGTIQLVARPDLAADECKAQLVAIAGGQGVQITWHQILTEPKPLGWIRVEGKGIPIDDSLIKALPPTAQDVVASLHPAGRIDAVWTARRGGASEAKPETDLDLHFHDGAVTYDRFAYPLRHVEGHVVAKNKEWQFEGLRGTNNAGVVTCSGRMTSKPEGNHLDLHFTGENIALEEDLRAALSSEAQTLWTKIRPRGRVDVTARMQLVANQPSASGRPKAKLAVTVRPRAGSVSVEPVFFPYRLDRLEGELTLADGHAHLADLRAQHGRTSLRARGEFLVTPGGAWQFTLDGLSADRLTADRDLIVALPAKLRRLVSDMRPEGNFSLDDSRLVFRGGPGEERLESSWKVNIGFDQGFVHAGMDLENIFGVVTLEGSAGERPLQAQGHLNLDSLTYRGFQFTEVRGPLRADEEFVLLGRWAARSPQDPPRHLTAKAYGGSLSAGVRIRHAGLPHFSLDAVLADGDLAELATEHLPGQHKLRGRIFGRFQLEGSGRSAASVGRSLNGAGQIQLRDADIYELPQIIALLQVLRIREPDTTAFKRSDMAFRIHGEHVYFDQLDLRGDAVSLFGKGEMGFDRQLNLAFQSIVGPGDLPLPLLRNFLREASGQVMQLHVRGSVEDPQFRSEPLPGLNHVLQQLSSELEPAARPIGQSRPPRDASRLFRPPPRQ